MKKIIFLVLSLLLIVSFASGCGTSDLTAKEIIVESIEKSKEIKTMSFDGNIKVAFDTTNANMTSEELIYLQMIPEIEFTFNGKQDIENMQAEFNVNARANFQGFDFSLDIPMIIKDNILYVKLPDIIKPQLLVMLPGIDPGKEYISIDMSVAMKGYDQKQDNEAATEMVTTIINSLDDNVFVKDNANNFTLLNGDKVKDVVNVVITQDNIKPLLKDFIENGLPLFFEYLDQQEINAEQKEQLQLFRDEINKEEINQSIDEINNYLTINSFKYTNIIDKKGFIRRSILNADITTHSENEGDVGISIIVEQNIDNINSEINFEMPIPTAEQTIDINEFAEMGNLNL